MASQEKDGQSRLKKLQKVRWLWKQKNPSVFSEVAGWKIPSFRDDFLIKEPGFLGDFPATFEYQRLFPMENGEPTTGILMRQLMAETAIKIREKPRMHSRYMALSRNGIQNFMALKKKGT